MLTDDLSPLLRLDGRVIFFPVRHHSPTAARLLAQLVQRSGPAAVLVEGPTDFNERIHELYLPHRPPLAIYSYVRLPDGSRRGAYYPFCEHSPEWQAVQTGHEVGARVSFIDLHWADLARVPDEPDNRYSDAHFRRSAYISRLCQQLGVEDFDSLWDTLIELDASLTVETYLERCHHLCGNMRLLEGAGSSSDRRREAFMAAAVRQTLADGTGQVLVVTGGYHSVALHARLFGQGLPELTEPAECASSPPQPGEERGIALTPYSFERLDSLTGYAAGMPNPGFYHQVWQDRQGGHTGTHRRLLERVAGRLRERRQAISSADLIAAEATAWGLAALRGHSEVWRTDLVDGLTGALIKDELARGGQHPLLDAVHEVLRGGERGLLAEGTVLPPLVLDIRRQLAATDLQPQPIEHTLELDLELPADRQRSRVLHQLRLLEVRSFVRTAGTDLNVRADLARVWELWQLHWDPDFDAGCIEAARYGPTLAEAAAARLAEKLGQGQHNAADAALLLIDAARAGLTEVADALFVRTQELIRADGTFFAVTAALAHLLYLYRYDAVLQTAGQGKVGGLLAETYARSVWLLETLGQVAGQDTALIEGVVNLRETLERCEQSLALDRGELLQVLGRLTADRQQRPLVRGAALGAQWSLGAADVEQAAQVLRLLSSPEQLGDFLTGLFALAREQVQRQRPLLTGIHDMLAHYSDEDFLAALPALRLAFTYFTPREKHHLALTLRELLGLRDVPEVAALAVDPGTAARALALESRLFASLRKYGVRGGSDESAQ
jgi:hypothetical protein